jgi:hypothetical protein
MRGVDEADGQQKRSFFTFLLQNEKFFCTFAARFGRKGSERE